MPLHSLDGDKSIDISQNKQANTYVMRGQLRPSLVARAAAAMQGQAVDVARGGFGGEKFRPDCGGGICPFRVGRVELAAWLWHGGGDGVVRWVCGDTSAWVSDLSVYAPPRSHSSSPSPLSSFPHTYLPTPPPLISPTPPPPPIYKRMFQSPFVRC